jgi:phosphate transport system substrate-binding protein
MENICLDIKEFKNAFPDPAARKNQCRQIREDGKFIEAGDSDNFIIQKLSHSSHALGIFGYNFLEQNQRIIHASVIDGVTPSDQTISKGSYKISRPLYIYLRKSELNINPQLKSFIEAFINARVIGPNGYLIHKGLIPISEKELEIIKNNVLG